MEVYLVATAILFGIGLLIFHFSKPQRLRRTLRAARRWPIAELPEDTRGKIVGRARPVDATLEGPISGVPCVAYEIIVTQRSGKNARTIIREVASVPFFVEDETGRALVDLDLRTHDLAALALTFDKVTTSGSLDDPTPREAALLERFERSGQGLLFNKSLTYREALIEVGEAVAILGSGTREPDPDAPVAAEYRGAPRTRLRMTGSPAHPITVSDAPETHR